MSDNEELIPLLPSISEMHKALLRKDEEIDSLCDQIAELVNVGDRLKTLAYFGGDKKIIQSTGKEWNELVLGLS